MKIGILTQPLVRNYGGILQCYALGEVLKGLGHEVCVLDRHHYTPFWKKVARTLKRSLLWCLKKERPENIWSVWTTSAQMKRIGRYTNEFIDQRITHTPPLCGVKELAGMARREGVQAYVVGSDQVWRPVFSPCISNYFLDFDSRKEVIRIAYAASFGVDTWEYSPKQQDICARYAKRFDAISVREESGVGLCRNFLGVEAIQVLDPTMLLSKEHYADVVKAQHVPQSLGNLMTYILDPSAEKGAMVKHISRELNLEPFSVMPSKEAGLLNCIRYPEECTSPPVEKWLRGFMDAEFVIADSFHGCVFSILFNKPFIAIVNKGRGETRFVSLLEMFGLTDRLVSDMSGLAGSMAGTPIDWERVNCILKSKREEAVSFLTTNLSK